ncbi:MAG TPA: hypothetical protein VFG54_02645 [Prolixibacteraceae bacterium]|nr:hypothetical protein [Prolixibacteraceae bacterium]
MKKLLLLLLVLSCVAAVAQDAKPKAVSMEFYGFVRFESYFDSYKGLNAANEQFFIVPLYAGMDATGKHINETPTYNFSAMATRVGVRISGPEILRAKTSANIETDFAGDLGVNPAMLRVRQANAVFSWRKSSLLVGQTWHPFWSGKVFPIVGGLNTGAPFQPFNRSPQVRFDYRPHSKIIVSGALISEFQYKSYGFAKIDSMYPKAMAYSDKSDLFNRNSAIPEITANLEMNNGGFTLGAGTSLKYIKPTLYTVGMEAGRDVNKYVSDELLRAVSFVGYSQYARPRFVVKAKAVVGQNMTHLTIPGGFGVKTLDPATGAMTYTPYNTFTSFVNAVYGLKYQAGIFAGYMQNLGTNDALHNFGSAAAPSTVTPGLVPNIASIYRVAPSLTLNVSKLRLTLEYELTNAEYGTGPIDAGNGLYDSTIEVTNHRAQLMMMYSF